MNTVFIDVDTQIDFLFPAGALYVPGSETIVANLAALNQHASAKGHRLISTMDAHAENDIEFRSWPAHCVVGTVGQQKPAGTLVSGQTLFPKVTTNAFATGEMDTLLDALAADQYVVYGVATDICVDFFLQGLYRRKQANIILVTDAIRAIDPAASDAICNTLTAAGGRLVTSADVLTT